MAEQNPIIGRDETVAAVAELAKRSAEPVKLDPGGAFYVPATDRRFTTEALLERPTSYRGRFTFDHLDSLLEYANQRGAAGDDKSIEADVLRLWCDGDRSALRITAVFDGHSDVGPGWHRHQATWQMQQTEAFGLLMAADGKAMGQVDFAEWIEDHAHLMLAPSPADMKQIALQFQAARNATLRSVKDLQTGAAAFAFDQDARAVGQVEVPHDVVFRLAAYVGFPEVDVTARLRWRVDSNSGKLSFHLRFIGLLAMRDGHWRKALEDATAVFGQRRIYMGKAPGESDAVKV